MTLPLPQPQAEWAHQKAVVLFSGGQDSTTCLYWALKHFGRVLALNLDYGQRHAHELEAALRIAAMAGVPLHVLQCSALQQVGGNALVDPDLNIEHQPGSLPSTFVPARNLVFLALAGAFAYVQGARAVVAGMCQTDHSGYPDCRQDFVLATRQALRLGLDAPLDVITPLMHLNKAQTWLLAQQLDCLDVVRLHSHTCYGNDRSHLHTWGWGCGHCPACQLRANGYAEAFPEA